MQLLTGIDTTTHNYILKTFLMCYKRYYPQIHPSVYYHSMTRRFKQIVNDPATTCHILVEDEVIVGFQIYKQLTTTTTILFLQHVKPIYKEFNFDADLTSLLPISDLILLPILDRKLKERLTALLPNTTTTYSPLEV